MTRTHQIAKYKTGVPLIAVAILLAITGLGVFSIGFDQGQIFSIVFGEKAYADMYLHEFTHDLRHAAGFPCH
ncbi:MAG: CbtB-domain containing protein [Thaumarchaeota archaeon]|nr:CbtB-domain containing protein [Nitrososphaerota archaeon]